MNSLRFQLQKTSKDYVTVPGDQVAVVHNGIIENHEILKRELIQLGYDFESDTDTEVIAHMIHHEVSRCGDFRAGVTQALEKLEFSQSPQGQIGRASCRERV